MDKDTDEETSEKDLTDEVGNPRISEMILTAMCRKQLRLDRRLTAEAGAEIHSTELPGNTVL